MSRNIKSLQPGTGFIIFIIFFGAALLESIRDKNFLLMLFWFCMGIFFLIADNIKNQS
ncbi:MAG: hypothetical protein ACJ749_00745 [Flavisolibacter sp.]